MRATSIKFIETTHGHNGVFLSLQIDNGIKLVFKL